MSVTAAQYAKRSLRMQLAGRELDVIRLLADGLTNRQIGAQLWITEQTVKFHMSNIYRKLGCTNRTQAAIAAYRVGILSDGDECAFCGGKKDSPVVTVNGEFYEPVAEEPAA